MSEAKDDYSGGDKVNASEVNKISENANDAGGFRDDKLAGETINGATLPVPVYQNTTDNEFYSCDANDTAKLEFAGFAISNSTNGNPIDLQFNGIVRGFSGLDEGEKYYVQDAVGTIGKTPGTRKILVGKAISTTELLIIKREIENNHFVGAGDNSPKDYWNFTLPFIFAALAWTTSNINGNFYRNSWFNSDVAADSSWYIYTASNIFVLANFSDTDIRIELGVKMSSISDDQAGFGFSNVHNAFQDYDDQVADAVCFTVAADGKLYAHTSNAAVGHTEVEITGITLTNLNTYRIEFDHGVEAKFYVNGILKATITTNLPDTELIRFGAGGTGNSNIVYYMTVPQVSVKK